MTIQHKNGRAIEFAYVAARDKLRKAYEAGRTGQPFDTELADLSSKIPAFGVMAEKSHRDGESQSTVEKGRFHHG